MTSSVATIQPWRAEADPAVLAARAERLPQLLRTVAAGAWCASTGPGVPAPDDWQRRDGEYAASWLPRRMQLLKACAACPVRAACEESALRQGEGDPSPYLDMVRGGRTASELHAARVEQAGRLEAAAGADQQALKEERELLRLWKELKRLAGSDNDHGRPNPKLNEKTREAAASYRGAVAARRARIRAAAEAA